MYWGGDHTLSEYDQFILLLVGILSLNNFHKAEQFMKENKDRETIYVKSSFYGYFGNSRYV